MLEVAGSSSRLHLWGWVREDLEKSVEAILILFVLRIFALVVLGNFVDVLAVVRFGTLWSRPEHHSSGSG